MSEHQVPTAPEPAAAGRPTTAERRHRLTTAALVVVVLVLGAGQLGWAAPWAQEPRALPSDPRGATFVPTAPVRVLDTRKPTGGHQGKFTAGETFALTVTGGTIPADASAVDINVTVTGASTTSHLRIFPTGGTLPTVSAINFDAGDTIANEYHTKISGGKVSIFNNSGTVDVIVDVVGYYRTASLHDLSTTVLTRSFNLTGKSVPAGECRSMGFVNNVASLQQGDVVAIRTTDPLADDLVIPTQTVTARFAQAGDPNPTTGVVVMICNPGTAAANFSGTEEFELRVLR